MHFRVPGYHIRYTLGYPGTKYCILWGHPSTKSGFCTVVIPAGKVQQYQDYIRTLFQSLRHFLSPAYQALGLGGVRGGADHLMIHRPSKASSCFADGCVAVC